MKETAISCMENLFLCRECNEYGKCSAVLIDCTNFTIWLQSTKKYERLILRGEIMSQWTHVNAIFRLNSIGRISDEQIIEMFGKRVSYKGMSSIEYDENYEIKNKEKYLPIGSEGTLERSIWHSEDESSLASTTVSIFGDLRDYGDFDEIERWFNKCCNRFWIRQAVCQVCVEGVGTKIFQMKE